MTVSSVMSGGNGVLPMVLNRMLTPLFEPYGWLSCARALLFPDVQARLPAYCFNKV